MSDTVVTPPCPNCQSTETDRLEIEAPVPAFIYRCSSCGHMWPVPVDHPKSHSLAFASERMMHCRDTDMRASGVRIGDLVDEEQRPSLCPQCDGVRGKPIRLVMSHAVRTMHYTCTDCSHDWHHSAPIR